MLKKKPGPKPRGVVKVRAHVCLPPDILELLHKLAHEDNLTASAWIESVIRSASRAREALGVRA